MMRRADQPPRVPRKAERGLQVVLLAFSMVFALGLAEIVLRVAPDLIDERAIDRFPDELRRTVARTRSLPTRDEAREMTTADRGDGGPPFHIPPGNRFVRDPADRVDRRAGAREGAFTDQLGFCNPRTWGWRQHVDIVMLGDSFTYCMAIDSLASSSTRLEVLTGRTVYNLSVEGVGPWEYLVMLRRFGLRLSPRAVVMNIYLGNDLRDVARYRYFRAMGTKLEDGPAPRSVEGFSVLKPIVSRSYLAALVAAASGRIRDAIAGYRVNTKEAEEDFRYTGLSSGRRMRMNVTNADTDEIRYARKLRTGEVRLEWFDEPLSEFARLAAEHAFVAVVALVPSMHTAYMESVVFSDPAAGHDASWFASEQRSWLKDASARHDLGFIDLTPALQRGAATGPLTHFPGNVHLTPFGHEIVAQELAALLPRLNLKGK